LSLRVLPIFSLCVSAVIAPLAAADEPPAPITAENVRQLAPIARIDFSDADTRVENGWFTLDTAGQHAAVISREQSLLVWDANGALVDQYSIPGSDGLPTTVLDAAFSPRDELLVSAHLEGGVFYAAYRWFSAAYHEYYQFPTQDVPLRIWADEHVWLEVSPFDYLQPRYVMRLQPLPLDRIRQNDILSADEITTLPSGPESDGESFVRVGRIEPPLAVTVTREGLVKRWDLQTGAVEAEAQMAALPGAGQISVDGRYFAWRDNDSRMLYLLDFETGTEREVAALDGAHIPFLLMTQAADLILGVNIAGAPVVAAWDVQTGTRIDLGAHRQCGRQPDMARLSKDGTTLVIGCDMGLEFWRIERS
jgi:hypothetical protein